ncbi:hypothetical protein RHS03_10003, partial [Rhizoctonia solani]
MSKLPEAGIYQIKHASTGKWLTMSSESSVIGSPTNTGKKSQWRLSPAPGVYGGYHVTSLEDDRYLNYSAGNNHIRMFTTGIWCLEDAGVAGQYYFHMQWNHFVATMSAADNVAKVDRWRGAAEEKWIFEFVGPLDKILPAPTLHQNIHYPFAPGHYVIRNVGTGTVMHAESGTGERAVVGHRANGSEGQKWYVRPTATGTAMHIKTVGGDTTGVQDLQQDTAFGIYQSLDTNYMLTITPADKGFWISPAAYPFHVLDVAGADPADGTKIVLWPMTGQEHQKWYFDPA